METLVPPPEAPVSAPQPVVGEVNPPISDNGIPVARRPDGNLALTGEEIRLLHQQRIEVLSDSPDAAGQAMSTLSQNAAAPTVGVDSSSLISLTVPQEPAITPIVNVPVEPLPRPVAQKDPPREVPKEVPKVAVVRQPVKDDSVRKLAKEETMAKKLDKISPAAGAGNRFVQLGSVKSEEAAKSGWSSMQKTYPAQLGSLSLSVQRVDLGTKGIYWRIRGGPLSEGEAKQVCTTLKSRGQDCILAK
jgi:hypothetical protein